MACYNGAACLDEARVRALGDAFAAYYGAEDLKEGQTSPYQALLDALNIGGSAGDVVEDVVDYAGGYGYGN